MRIRTGKPQPVNPSQPAPPRSIPEQVAEQIGAAIIDGRHRPGERLIETVPERQACKLMVGLLDLAARGACDVQLAQILGGLLQAGTLPDLEGLEARFAPRQTPLPAVTVALPALSVYDGLYEVAV